jgi:hypothetical protein
MANDMRLAAQVINRLVEAIGTAASAVNTAIARLIERATGHWAWPISPTKRQIGDATVAKVIVELPSDEPGRSLS